MPRPALTILWLHSEHILRADLPNVRAAELRHAQEPRGSDLDLASLVERALQLNPERPARSVLVLVSELFCQVLSLPAAATRGASPAELSQALRLEAENVGGLSGFEELCLAQQELAPRPGERSFKVYALPRAELELIEDALGRAGAKLLGLTHPAAGPIPNPAGTWQRIELWPERVFFVRGAGDALLDLEVLEQDPRLGLWPAAFESWRAEQPEPSRRELLIATSPEGLPPGLTADPPSDLRDPNHLEPWLLAWARGASRITAIIPQPRPTSRRARQLRAGILTTLVLGSCAAHFENIRREPTAIADERARLAPAAQRLTQLRRDADDIARPIDAARKRLAALDLEAAAVERTIAVQRSRCARLLARLAQELPESLVIESIRSQAGTVTISGLGTDARAAGLLAAHLALRLEGLGWQVQAPREQALADGTLAFELELRDFDPEAPIAQANRATAAGTTGERGPVNSRQRRRLAAADAERGGPR